MKRYIIINGTTAMIVERKSIDAARDTAINLCDHSQEIIVREITELTDYSKVYENMPA